MTPEERVAAEIVRARNSEARLRTMILAKIDAYRRAADDTKGKTDVGE